MIKFSTFAAPHRMRNKRQLAFWCVNLGLLGWSVLEYARGTKAIIVVSSALLSLLLLNGTVWFFSRRTGLARDNESKIPAQDGAKRPMAFWFGVMLACLGTIPIGLWAWHKIRGGEPLHGLALWEGVVPLAYGTYVMRRCRRT